MQCEYMQPQKAENFFFKELYGTRGPNTAEP